MKIFLKILAGVFFTPILLIFLILTSLTFQILNDGYLLPAFERHGVYEKIPILLKQSLPNDPNLPEEEREAYGEIAGSIKPETAKGILEGIVKPILDFVHGRSGDVEIAIKAKELEMLGASNITWKLSSSPPETWEKAKLANGIWNKLVMAWIVILLMLIGLGFFVGKKILLIDGILLTIYALVIKFFLIQMGRDLPNQPEPAQKLLGLLASTILPEIFNIWLIVGIVLIVIWLILKIKAPGFHRGPSEPK